MGLAAADDEDDGVSSKRCLSLRFQNCILVRNSASSFYKAPVIQQSVWRQVQSLSQSQLST